MNPRAQVRLLKDGKRIHLNDGPIDLIVEACGKQMKVNAAFKAAVERFRNVLDELCCELTLLRQATRVDGRSRSGVGRKTHVTALRRL